MNDDLRLERTAADLLDAAAPSRAPAGLLADTLASVSRTSAWSVSANAVACEVVPPFTGA